MNESNPSRKSGESETKMIVGLGNPGNSYIGTRHNIGFQVLDRIAKTLGAGSQLHRPSYYAATIKTAGKNAYLLWPVKYMNLSGDSILCAIDDFELTADNLLIVTDDLNIGLGAIRVRSGGSNGGHNGLGSISEALGTEEFARLRVGVGPYADTESKAGFVLGRFEEKELETVNSMVDIAAKAAIFAIHHSLNEVMTKFNHNPAQSDESLI